MTTITIPSLPKIADVSSPAPTDEDLPPFVHWRRCEPVGHWFEGTFDPETNGVEISAEMRKGKTNIENTGTEQQSRKTFDSKKVVKMSDEDLETDWYEILELEQDDAATYKEIRKAYRKRCLDTHPDKQRDGSDHAFKQVQRAFDILGNEESRRAFDSSRPFDDSIPGENVEADKFYSTFGPVFERNKKWSQDGNNTPSLGDEKTDINTVNKFYNAWMGFKSWRDFSHDVDVQEINENMCREEKRYYQRENQKAVEKARKSEAKRVRTLVERAMAVDPRIKAHKDAEEAKHQAELDARNAARQARLDEERQRRQAEADAKKAAEEKEKKDAEDSKTLVKNCLIAVRDFLNENELLENIKTNKFFPDKIRVPNLMWLFNKGASEKLEEYVATIKKASRTKKVAIPAGTTYTEDGAAGEGIEAVIVFNKLVEAQEQEIGTNRFGESLKKAAAGATTAAGGAPAATATTKQKAVTWNDDDLLVLQKAIKQYPGGTVERWRKIKTMLRDKFSEEEVLHKTKEMEKVHLNDKSAMKQKMPDLPAATHADPVAKPAASSVEDWTPKQQKQLEGALRELKDYKEKDKWTKVAAHVDGKKGKECFDRFKHLCALNKAGKK